MSSAGSKQAAASKLGDLLVRLSLDQHDQWSEIESTARGLADDLRVKDGQAPILAQCSTMHLRRPLPCSRTTDRTRKVFASADSHLSAQGHLLRGPNPQCPMQELHLRVAARRRQPLHGSRYDCPYLSLSLSAPEYSCYITDENRGSLLDAGFLDAVVQMLENYAQLVDIVVTPPVSISIADLKVIKTSVGLLLNASIGFGGFDLTCVDHC